MANQTIADLALGSTIYLYENGEPTEYFIAEHGTNETTIVRGLLYNVRRMNATNVATYNGCEMDVWLSDISSGFLSVFDTATRSAFTAKTIKVQDIDQGAVIELARTAFLLSCSELGYGASPDEGNSMMTAFEAYTGLAGNSARISYNSAAAAQYWWLRSPSSATQFRGVHTNGTLSVFNASISNVWVRPALSVANATSVSDDTEETIYLLPDPNKKYTSVDGVMIVGTTSSRPSKARLIIPVNNLYDTELYVSNNAGDANPVWVACTNGGTCTLANTTKETTDWTLGVKMYGKSGGRGSFGEPVLLVEEDAT